MSEHGGSVTKRIIIPFRILRGTIIVFGILLIDFITKWFLITPFHLQHHVNPYLIHGWFDIFILILIVWVASYNLGGSITMGGVFGNVIDSVDGLIQNPFVIHFEAGDLGFNFADTSIVIGSIFMAVSLAWYIVIGRRKNVRVVRV